MPSAGGHHHPTDRLWEFITFTVATIVQRVYCTDVPPRTSSGDSPGCWLPVSTAPEHIQLTICNIRPHAAKVSLRPARYAVRTLTLESQVNSPLTYA